ncbi:hypothetical protein WA026_014355 [Henosepilachna vigintioctopunctata]|uniref:Angiotensin-converting enzyme n=1 Tax=Henosepilachna vigintioctopunctata TaxID=420089 RepID=A0AAW1ULU2_9CUCU
MCRLVLVIFAVISATQLAVSLDPEIEEEEIRARAFMSIISKEIQEEGNVFLKAEWDYVTNLTDENLKKKTDISSDIAVKSKKRSEEVKKFNWKTFSDKSLKRQFLLSSIPGTDILSKDEVTKLEKLVGDMEKAFSTAKICDFNDKLKCDLELDPDIVKKTASSRDEKELRHIWVSWRNAFDPKIKPLFKDSVDLFNKAAKLNNFNDTGHMWLFAYEEFEIKDIKSQFQSLWEQVKPLYQQLHAYIRHQLRKVYGDIVTERGPIPAHLFGDPWALDWANIAEDFKPYPKAAQLNVTENLLKQNYTVEKIFKTAEDFFVSIGFPPMTQAFWKNSIFVKPQDREIVCHASAWDFHDGDDFRLKMCATVSKDYFNIAHHEMGHIEYFMQYKDQPVAFRDGANPGFHEAIGDLILLSVQSPKHLEKLNLSNASSDNSEVMLNNLFEVAMTQIPALPYSYMLEQWRWKVFSGEIPYDEYNCKWWELRDTIQGVEPPVQRSEEDFDPGCKYHIPAIVPYIRYFVSHILQFQFHRSLCEKAGQYDRNNPSKLLYLCDIYQNKEAGSLLKQMLQMGSSKPWPEALHALTGQRIMDASAVLEYFRPLQTWLEKYNRENDVHIGWDKSTKSRYYDQLTLKLVKNEYFTVISGYLCILYCFESVVHIVIIISSFSKQV